MQHRDIHSGQRAQVSPQAVGAGTRKQAVDHSMRASPDGYSAREQRSTRGRQLQPATASVVGVDHHHDEAAPQQRLDRGGERRTVHGKHGCDPTDAGRLGPVQRHHHRILPAGQAERPQRLVETPCERPRRALQLKAQARVPNEVRGLEGNFGCL
jgi:hypothetical protein